MIIRWFFDDDSMMIFVIFVIIWVIWSISVQICKVNDSSNFAFSRLCCLKIQVVRPARPAKVISDLLDSSLQRSPARFDFDGENRTNARMQTRHYSFCIWNSRIVWPACFAFVSFDLFCVCLLALRLTLCVWPSKGNMSIWASWFTLATVTAVRNALLWPNSLQTKEQKAKPMIFVNERDDFILVGKMVRRNVLKGLSLRRRSIRKQNSSIHPKFIKTVMWF